MTVPNRPPPVSSEQIARARRAALDAAFAPSLDEIDPVPWAAVEQARALGRLKRTLLEDGAYTHESLAHAWDVSVEAARQRVARARSQHLLFSVSLDGTTLVPAFLLNDVVELRPELRDAIAALRGVGEDGWALWSWFVTPSGWLDGAIPADEARRNPALVTDAARRVAAATES